MKMFNFGYGCMLQGDVSTTHAQLIFALKWLVTYLVRDLYFVWDKCSEQLKIFTQIFRKVA